MDADLEIKIEFHEEPEDNSACQPQISCEFRIAA
jgi:hypothetical protein